MIADLGNLLKTKNVDLVVLNDSPLLLAFNIIRDGIILKSDEKRKVNFETQKCQDIMMSSTILKGI
ncbi:nucleotidyltransferase [Methanosarcina barkeri str. Wiesmoor]|uniref:Nucleotidyltransferase n=2 Tax=Methanosarcina barkeri TaxID=2208 RepID=A0A0E3QLV0_METBA|nr:nucleotidyltransferase domain-containing protein [Methanosarcina barkeri]AKB50962.1 nucleotidyltransferase [Methanosarcina barkeri str. Wiesmoor]